MILADKIIEERKRLGWSQEELAEQLDVSRQSISKWESAQSIPDITRIIQMSELFGVSTDYLLKDDAVLEKKPLTEETVSKNTENVRSVSMEEASAYLTLKAKQAPEIAFGVALCILSSAPLMFLSAVYVQKGLENYGNVVSVVGVSILLILVAAAVFLFIKCGNESQKYEYLEKSEIETAYGVDGMVKEKRTAFGDKYTRSVAVGVVLCIVSAIPLILSTAFGENEALETAMVGVLLMFIAAAVYLFVRAGTIKESYDILLQEGDFTVNKKQNAPLLRRISAIYWLIILAVYLAISLPAGKWDITWVIWPVSGILFGVVITATKMVIKAEE